MEQLEIEKCAWDNCPEWSNSPNIINVHLVPHSHDDMGWIKTVDDYYTGARPRLVPVGVQYILNTVIDELLKDASRRFCYAEAGFLHRWLLDHNNEQKEKLLHLIVKSGQMEIIGGGWTQPDEATTHYIDIISQYSTGLALLNSTYGNCGRPRVAWQIDPFGHSREHSNIAKLLGNKALFFARTHYKELKYRADNKQLEFRWKVTSDEEEEINSDNSILTGAFLRGTYAPPNKFCFDSLCDDEPIVDNKQFEGYNVDKRLEEFFKYINDSVNTQLHKHVLMTMGGDFHYSNANQWFTQLDKLISAINSRTNKTGIYAFYSTPGCYAKALELVESNLLTKSFPSKINGDFFPYASSNHSYWTGYFTSKPAFKGLVRFSSALLQLSQKLASFSKILSKPFYCPSNECEPSFPLLLKLEGALALSTHHDAVTGTSKHNVTMDYIKRLLSGWDQAEKVINNSFWQISSLSTEQQDKPSLIFCRKLNQSICNIPLDQQHIAIILFNGGVRQIEKNIRLPLSTKPEQIKIINSDGKEINIEIIKTFLGGNEQIINNSESISPYELLFEAQIPPLGFSTYFMLINTNLKINNEEILNKKEIKKRQKKSEHIKNNVEIENNFFSLSFNNDGLLNEVKDIRRSNKTFKLNQQFFYYKGMGNKDLDGHYQQASGAYIFRPNGSEPQPFEGPIQNIQVIKNLLVQEVRQTINPWISQIIRLFPNKPFIEFQWKIGPLPKNKTLLESIEVITKYTIEGFKSSQVFWTDANGRQMIKRKRNDPERFYEGSEPAAGNYFPVNSRIWIEDSSDRMTILTDRSQGGASLNDGQIELMLHRRCFFDDAWGVEEALDEPGEDGRGLIVQGKHWLLLNEKNVEEHRPLAFDIFEENAPQTIAFIPLDNLIKGNISRYRELYRTEFSGISADSLPSTINILTLTPIGNKTNELLIRLEHFYQKNELKAANISSNVVEHIDLKKLFLPHFNVISAEELALGADRPVQNNKTKQNSNLIISLKPMEIRTFKLIIK
uniref:Alpha-mannosidase n=1 Tax=Meloidogyne enterolobii TaxID=390850 RepID=A0A6V7URF5_MELEN|nr:unnamed protein product [Meloidogyne enterolobii]